MNGILNLEGPLLRVLEEICSENCAGKETERGRGALLYEFGDGVASADTDTLKGASGSVERGPVH
jgi:hypothetical protein